MDETMTGGRAPGEIVALADQRSAARAARDWPEADRLRALIEAAGWKVVDSGTAYRLAPAHPPTIVEGGRTRYGRSADVPSRLEEAPVGTASIVMIAGDSPADLVRVVGRLADHAPDGTQVIVVAQGPSSEPADRLSELDALDPGAPGVETEVVWLSGRLGYAAALNAGIRRSAAPVVILMDTTAEPAGDVVSPLVRLLDDQAVGVAGAFGLRSGDLRHFEDASAGEVDAIDGVLQAFRRSDYVRRGPLDEKFLVAARLDVWWSLVLRDEGEDRQPRRAVAVELPVARHEDRAATGFSDDEQARLSRRNFYRVVDRFGQRPDLLLEPVRPGRPRSAGG